MFKFSQCPLLSDVYILHILGSFFILELTKTLLRVKKNHETTNLTTKKYNHETNAMVFLLSKKRLPLNEHCILPRATCIKYVIEDVVIVYPG